MGKEAVAKGSLFSVSKREKQPIKSPAHGAKSKECQLQIFYRGMLQPIGYHQRIELHCHPEYRQFAQKNVLQAAGIAVSPKA